MDDSTTDDKGVNTGGQEPLPADDTSKQTSAEQQSDAASGGEPQDDADSNKGNQDEPKGDDDKPKIDESLAKFAKSQGFDPDDLTEREAKALKIAHDNQKEFHKKRQEEADALRNTVGELHDPDAAVRGEDDEYIAEQKRLRAEMTQLKQYQRVNEFWRQNPDAKDYEEDMNRLVLEEKEKYGVESAIFLSRNLDRLYKLAKADRMDPDSLKESGRREEREELRRKQEASADSGSASTSTGRSSTKIDQKWIDETYDPSNAEHRKMLDAYLSGSR